MIEPSATDWFYSDIERLRRFKPMLAESVFDLLDNHLAAYGGVPVECDPHRLKIGNGCLSGYMECHVEPNVLLIYRVVGYRVLVVRLCTHWELYTCRFDPYVWPDPSVEAAEKAAHDMTDEQIETELFESM